MMSDATRDKAPVPEITEQTFPDKQDEPPKPRDPNKAPVPEITEVTYPDRQEPVDEDKIIE